MASKEHKIVSCKNIIKITDEPTKKTGPNHKTITLNHIKKPPQVKCTDSSRSGPLNPGSSELRMNGNIFYDQGTLPSLTLKDIVTMDATLDDDLYPLSPVPNVKSNQALYYFSDAEDLCLAYSDLTGKFPLKFSHGNNYQLIAYHPNANVILVKPIKNQQAKILADTWTVFNERFTTAGLMPST